MPKTEDAGNAPQVLLANSWENDIDLTGWWMSEKLDGVPAWWDGKPVPTWHAKLLAMLPTIIRYAKRTFRSYDPEARQEAVQNVVANTTATVAGLARRGKLDLA